MVSVLSPPLVGAEAEGFTSNLRDFGSLHTQSQRETPS